MSELTDTIPDLVPLPEFDKDWEKNKPYRFGDFAIVIEYKAGDTRTKVKNGLTVSNTFPCAYGEILRTTDQHGECIDMYLANMPSENALIYVIDQVDPATGYFDEHKVMLGFGSSEEAVQLYTDVFGDKSGNARLGAVTIFHAHQFLTWLTEEGASMKPALYYSTDEVIHTVFAGIVNPPKPMIPLPRDNTGGAVIPLPDLSKGPQIVTKVPTPGVFCYHINLYSALDVEVWSNPTDTFCRLLDLATDKDEVHIHIASPGGSVMLMGRWTSAMNRTKAKVFTYAEGCVASAATAIWAAGHERSIRPASFFMQHMSSQLLVGKTSDIAAKSIFCVNYIEKQLKQLITIGLFTAEEVSDMIEKSSDIYISGREAIARVGKTSAQSKR